MAESGHSKSTDSRQLSGCFREKQTLDCQSSHSIQDLLNRRLITEIASYSSPLHGTYLLTHLE